MVYVSFQVFIEVLNENDNVPLSEKAVYYPTVPEESPEGRSVLQIRASDEDKDPNQKITYQIISGNPEGFFSINSVTGKWIYLFTHRFTENLLNLSFVIVIPQNIFWTNFLL